MGKPKLLCAKHLPPTSIKPEPAAPDFTMGPTRIKPDPDKKSWVELGLGMTDFNSSWLNPSPWEVLKPGPTRPSCTHLDDFIFYPLLEQGHHFLPTRGKW